MIEYITKENDVLDEIAWRYYGSNLKTIEPVLEANRGVAEIGLIYSAGIKIFLPDIQKPPVNETIKLWD